MKPAFICYTLSLLIFSSCRNSAVHTTVTADPLVAGTDSLYNTAVAATGLTGIAADRAVVRTLMNAWGHCADRRLAHQQALLFTPEGIIEVYNGDPEKNKKPPVAVQHGRQEIESAVKILRNYETTTHFMGQSTLMINGNKAVGETYGIAYQLSASRGERKLSTLYIRYLDQLQKNSNHWFFAKRKLIIDWTDTRVSVP